jgi:hypothetical protein
MSVVTQTSSTPNVGTTPFYFRLLMTVVLASAIGRTFMESIHIVAPFTSLSSKHIDWNINETKSMGLIRGTIMYLPKEALVQKNSGNEIFVRQAKWFLRSWEETCKYLISTDRIDVLIVVSNKNCYNGGTVSRPFEPIDDNLPPVD